MPGAMGVHTFSSSQSWGPLCLPPPLEMGDCGIPNPFICLAQVATCSGVPGLSVSSTFPSRNLKSCLLDSAAAPSNLFALCFPPQPLVQIAPCFQPSEESHARPLLFLALRPSGSSLLESLGQVGPLCLSSDSNRGFFGVVLTWPSLLSASGFLFVFFFF